MAKRFNNKFQNKSDKKFKNKRRETVQPETEELTTSRENIFDFDNDTSIVAKLKGHTKQKSSNANKSSWNYGGVIEEETNYLKLQEEKKGEEQKGKIPKRSETAAPDDDVTMADPEEEVDDNVNFDKFESDVYAQNASFTDFNLSRLILKGCAKLEFFKPTKVQEKVIPLVLKGLDVLVNSETGSGKTACYLLPILQHIISHKQSNTPIKALVLLPTRELAFQCGAMLKAFTEFLDITYVSICGGMSAENQSNILKNHPDVILATPGRLIDMIYNYKSLDLQFINILVLDEADKLLELGFKDAIMELINLMKNNGNRQTLLFSATLNPKIIDLGKDALKRPVKIKMVRSAILSNLKQSIVRMKFKQEENDENLYEKRFSYLLYLLSSNKRKRTIIFFNTKKECHKAFVILGKFNIKAAEIHSDIPQTDRLQSLEDFQNNKINYLLATDIAGRGIDIEKVRCVINFQMPMLIDRYVHRIGRTARKGYMGEAITICDDGDRQKLKGIAKKEKYKLDLVKIDNNDIRKYYKQVVFDKEAVDQVVENDEVDKELREADKEVGRAINLKLHSKEIMNRPKK